MNLTHIPHHAETGGDYVRIKFRPVAADGTELRARWAWAVRLHAGQTRLPRYLLITREGENVVADREQDNVITETRSILVGTPMEERPAAMNLKYGWLEEV